MTDKLAGLNIPERGKRVYKEDWDTQFRKRDEEITNRDRDMFGYGIQSGGEITIQGQSIVLHETIAYNLDGQRIEVPETTLEPPTGTSILCISHTFLTTLSEPDFSLSANEYRENSYTIEFRETPTENEIVLYEINKTTSIQITDLRFWRTIKTKNIADNAITDDKLASSTKIGGIGQIASKILNRFTVEETRNLVNSLNHLLEIVDEQDNNLTGRIDQEIQDRANADSKIQSSLQQSINAHAGRTDNPHGTNWSNLPGKPSSFPPSSHSHSFSSDTYYLWAGETKTLVRGGSFWIYYRDGWHTALDTLVGLEDNSTILCDANGLGIYVNGTKLIGDNDNDTTTGSFYRSGIEAVHGSISSYAILIRLSY